MKKIALIGSTGSVGRQVLEVIRGNAEFEIETLTCHTNTALLEQQIKEFRPRAVCVTGSGFSSVMGEKVFTGKNALVEAVTDETDLVFVAVTGFAGLKIVLRAIETGKNVALANKEALVCGGELVTKLAAEKGVEIIPVDSEHSALWQALNFKKTGYKKLILTASGGPFRTANLREMRHFTAADALRHPNWKMGRKITVDCATMLNKGFEVIEAHHLFGAPADKIEVVVHPQSIIHSMVEFDDNSVMAELSYPDMSQPIQLALTYPEKLPSPLPSLDFAKIGKLEFFPLDREKFPCFGIALNSLEAGDNYPCAMNAASEVAVNAFLCGKIPFTSIAEVIGRVTERAERLPLSVENLEVTDALARKAAEEEIKKHLI